MTKTRKALVATICAAVLATPALAQKKYGPGVSDTEIKIGQTMAYSGPASGYGALGKVQAAYFKMINEQGGINGRKISFVSLDDAFSPPKTVEGVRRLVEQEGVLALFGMIGTATNSAVHRYINARKVPHLFITSGATKWNDPKGFPWTVPFYLSYHSEAIIYAKHIMATKPGAKIAVLYQNDDYGKDYLKGFKEGLGAKANMIVAEASYELSDPTVDSQIITLKNSGADVLVGFVLNKAAAQSIRKVYDLGWKPTRYLSSTSTSIAAVLKPAGVEKAIGIYSLGWYKDPSAKQWESDPWMKEHQDFMKKYMPEANAKQSTYVPGVLIAQTMVEVLKACGDDLTRENVLKQATSINDLQLPGLLPGIKLNTSPDNYSMLHALQLVQFDGAQWARRGELMSVK